MPCSLQYLCVLSVFIVSGNCLSCIQCSGYSDSPCNGTSQTCSSASDVCGTTRIQTFGKSWDSFFYIRSCVPLTECDINGTTSGLYTNASLSTTCCYSDNCIASIPTMPVENSTENGLICQTYLETDLEPCEVKTRTNCTGDQNLCIRYYSSMTIGKAESTLLFGGCASESLCNSTRNYISTPGFSLLIKKSCNSNANSLYQSAILLSLFLLLHFHLNESL
ncbi:phospholipase A2 inhibitor and Ly6/PLAUR domain-containing protein-like [Xenopus laevis]|uniref:UPAR/Ly6 domain-containing protein n=2 Tax=Xenopus laevis TaxID=8355 RepID=A0A974CH32_XENLA|nr:phospholipase A2 inhibitor and Ly6/PLAUR domain-containing protein-like [Xenopus laevis]OCT73274.1 hypothetical protein XELAEV_18036254mg [Xenopus laevis]